MAIRQVSVFVENRPGKLHETLKMIADSGLNIRALSIAETKDFGILAAKLEDRVGALCYVLDFLAQAEVNIEYIYAFTASEDFGAYVVIRVDDAQKAEEVLKAHNIPTLCEDDIKDI